jgi:hypothetical protein
MPAAPRLHELQRGFADALLGRGDAVAVWVDGAGLNPSARLRIDQHAGAAAFTAALRDSYPTVHALVGEAFFDMLAARYRQPHPSTSGNLQQFGGALADFMASMPEVQTLKYLFDASRLDWPHPSRSPDGAGISEGLIGSHSPGSNFGARNHSRVKINP